MQKGHYTWVSPSPSRRHGHRDRERHRGLPPVTATADAGQALQRQCLARNGRQCLGHMGGGNTRHGGVGSVGRVGSGCHHQCSRGAGRTVYGEVPSAPQPEVIWAIALEGCPCFPRGQ